MDSYLLTICSILSTKPLPREDKISLRMPPTIQYHVTSKCHIIIEKQNEVKKLSEASDIYQKNPLWSRLTLSIKLGGKK